MYLDHLGDLGREPRPLRLAVAFRHAPHAPSHRERFAQAQMVPDDVQRSVTDSPPGSAVLQETFL